MMRSESICFLQRVYTDPDGLDLSRRGDHFLLPSQVHTNETLSFSISYQTRSPSLEQW
jgi:hypothetical protein